MTRKKNLYVLCRHNLHRPNYMVHSNNVTFFFKYFSSSWWNLWNLCIPRASCSVIDYPFH